MSRAASSLPQSRVTQLASLPSVHEAFRWLHLGERRIMEWQRGLVAIPAPPFGEGARAKWLAERFRELQLEEVKIDSEGNVLASLKCAGESGADEPAELGDPEDPCPCILLSAHIDTAFPPETPITVKINDRRLEAPGACDNGAGVAALLAIAAAIRHSGVWQSGSCQSGAGMNLLFAGNVGEEGDGNLRGMRALYASPKWRSRIAAHIVRDGAGAGAVVTEALGCGRYLAAIGAPGGHSWADAGSPNSILLMCQAISAFEQANRENTAPGTAPRTTWNVGTIAGGSSINSIPERTEARFDFRSLGASQLVAMEVALHRAIEDAVIGANQTASRSTGRTWRRKGTAERKPARAHFPTGRREPVSFEIQKIGDRPPGRLPADAPLLGTLRAVDRHLGIRTEEQAASTDANIPLSMGIPAIAIGAGGSGGGIHTRAEWYDATGRDLALRRILLLLLGTASSVPSHP